MSTIEQTRRHGPFTWDELADVPDDGLRREIIGGTLIVNAAPMYRHQLVAQRLGWILDHNRSAELAVIMAPFDYRYDETNYVEPDVLVARAEDLDLDDHLRHPAVPVLLVEVLPPSNTGYDRLLKRDLYERLGVPSYWLVHPGATDRAPSIVVLELDGEGPYQTVVEATGDDTVTVGRPFPVSFTPAALLRR